MNFSCSPNSGICLEERNLQSLKEEAVPHCLPLARSAGGLHKITFMSGTNYFVLRQKLSHLNNIFPTLLSQGLRAALPKNEIFGSLRAFLVFLSVLLIL